MEAGNPSQEDQRSELGHGFRVENPTPEDLREVLEAAFDYRGDVSLTLQSGETVTGYIFNRVDGGEDPYLALFEKGSDERRRICYRDITGIAFTGKDTASGRSWETWVKKYEEKKAARERGEDTGPIRLDPEPLE